MNKAAGWIGSQMLAWCGLPAVIAAVQTGTTKGYSGGFLGMWLTGELLCLYYILGLKTKHTPLVINYLINIVIITILLYYKL